jgi:hypothetical protein
MVEPSKGEIGGSYLRTLHYSFTDKRIINLIRTIGKSRGNIALRNTTATK